MLYSIDYCTYEYGVLRGLADIFKEVNITLSSDTYKAYKTTRSDLGSLEQSVVAQFDGDRHLTFHLNKDFNVGLEERVIVNAYNNNAPIETTTHVVADIIKSEWLKLILK